MKHHASCINSTLHSMASYSHHVIVTIPWTQVTCHHIRLVCTTYNVMYTAVLCRPNQHPDVKGQFHLFIIYK